MKNDDLKELQEIADIIQGYSFSIEQRRQQGEYLILTPNNIRNGELIKTSEDEYTGEVDDTLFRKCILQKGDIIVKQFAIGNELIYKETFPQAVINQDCTIIRSPNNPYIKTYFQVYRGNREISTGTPFYGESAEFAENPEPRCACIILIDLSESMDRKQIRALNKALQIFQKDVAQDDLASKRVEVAIITFGEKVRILQDFVTADDLCIPHLEILGGLSNIEEALCLASDMIKDRTETYKANGSTYYRPWIFLITNSSPTNSIEWELIAQRISQEESARKFAFFSVSITGSNVLALSQISIRRPAELKNFEFSKMFIWLSRSLQAVSHSKVGEQVPLQPPIEWAKISLVDNNPVTINMIEGASKNLAVGSNKFHLKRMMELKIPILPFPDLNIASEDHLLEAKENELYQIREQLDRISTSQQEMNQLVKYLIQTIEVIQKRYMLKTATLNDDSVEGLSFALYHKIVDFLISLPNIDDNNTQRALIYSSVLDEELQRQVSFANSALQFFQLLVPTLSKYGKLKDGRNALEAVLDASKKYISRERQEYCDKIIGELIFN